MKLKDKLPIYVKKNLAFGLILLGAWIVLSYLFIQDIDVGFLSSAEFILFLEKYWLIVIPLLFLCFNCVFCFNPYRFYREKSRLIAVKTHFYIATNLYLCMLLFFQLFIIPIFDRLYENRMALLPLPTFFILVFSKYWFIFTPLMFIVGNGLVIFVCVKFKNILERPFSFFYGILIIVSFITFFVISISLYLPLFDTGPPMK